MMERAILGIAFILAILILGITLTPLSNTTRNQSDTRILDLENKIIELEERIDNCIFKENKK